jgi:hypothetical protein
VTLPREEYITPVGFAREPAKERRRWWGRIFLALLVAALVYVLFTRVINPPTSLTPQPALSSALPSV